MNPAQAFETISQWLVEKIHSIIVRYGNIQMPRVVFSFSFWFIVATVLILVGSAGFMSVPTLMAVPIIKYAYHAFVPLKEGTLDNMIRSFTKGKDPKQIVADFRHYLQDSIISTVRKSGFEFDDVLEDVNDIKSNIGYFAVHMAVFVDRMRDRYAKIMNNDTTKPYAIVAANFLRGDKGAAQWLKTAEKDASIVDPTTKNAIAYLTAIRDFDYDKVSEEENIIDIARGFDIKWDGWDDQAIMDMTIEPKKIPRVNLFSDSDLQAIDVLLSGPLPGESGGIPDIDSDSSDDDSSESSDDDTGDSVASRVRSRRRLKSQQTKKMQRTKCKIVL
jgi:hypothetical protein